LDKFRGALDDQQLARQQLERLQKELEARESTIHFAHAGVSLLFALILAAAAVKLFWDSIRLPILGIAAAVCSAALMVHSIRRYLRGQRALKWELQRYERLRALRRSLHIDDPSALLPR
jgi:hypothetical protein